MAQAKDTLPLDQKQCTKCKETKPLSAFPYETNHFRADCKDCRNRHDRERKRNRTPTPYPTVKEKQCLACKEIKPANAFQRRTSNKDGLFRHCKECYDKSYRVYALQRDFGISPEQYQALLTEQEGRCKICGRLPQSRRLSVDHCHATGKVRGLLCGQCNHGIGNFQDDPRLLKAAAEYLNATLE